jgi:hypothetical protein
MVSSCVLQRGRSLSGVAGVSVLDGALDATEVINIGPAVDGNAHGHIAGLRAEPLVEAGLVIARTQLVYLIDRFVLAVLAFLGTEATGQQHQR